MCAVWGDVAGGLAAMSLEVGEEGPWHHERMGHQSLALIGVRHRGVVAVGQRMLSLH